MPQYDAGLPSPAGDLVATGQGAAGNVPNMFSAAGVRYFDGAVRVASTDLASAGFGLPFGITRSWTNLSNVANGFSGAGMVVTDLPHLRQDNGGNTLVAIANGFNARWFDLSGSTWTPRFFVQDTLVANTTTHEFVETDSTGAQVHYNDFSGSVPANEQGTFKVVAAAGAADDAVCVELVGWLVEEPVAPLLAGPVAVTELPPVLSAVVGAALVLSVVVFPAAPPDADEESPAVSNANKPPPSATPEIGDGACSKSPALSRDQRSASSKVSIRSCCQPSMNTAEVSTAF